MENQETYQQAFISSLQHIAFTERYKSLSEKFSEPDLSKLEKKTDNKQIIKMLCNLGYNFVFYKGGAFDLKQDTNGITFQINFSIKAGMIASYLGIIKDGTLINDVNKYYNFGFIYRSLANDKEAKITLPKFKDYNEFQEISKEILMIYEDFKREFLTEISK